MSICMHISSKISAVCLNIYNHQDLRLILPAWLQIHKFIVIKVRHTLDMWSQWFTPVYPAPLHKDRGDRIKDDAECQKSMPVIMIMGLTYHPYMALIICLRCALFS